MKQKKNAVLLFIKTPPPVTGATLMNQRVHDSKLLREHFSIRSICISYMQKRTDMGKWQVKKFFGILYVLSRLIYELSRHRPAFVYFQLSPHRVAFIRDLIFVSVIKLFGIKILYHLHGKGIKENAEKKWKKLLYQYAFKKSDIICLSKLLIYDIEDVFSGQIHIVPNGIPDISNTASSREKEKHDYPKILFLSNLIKAKGLFDFIESLRILKNKGLSFEGIIVGSEADVTQCELLQQIERKGLKKHVQYLGPKYGEDKSEVLRQSDIMVFPSTNETFGNVILEAMQHSTPVIASNITSIPEIIDHNKTGFLVEPNSPQQIATKLELLINNPELRISLGQAGRKKYEETYTLQHFEQKMKYVFENVLQKVNINKQ
jgi:glycosyltransferase involved in cell wall biosynthesis